MNLIVRAMTGAISGMVQQQTWGAWDRLVVVELALFLVIVLVFTFQVGRVLFFRRKASSPAFALYIPRLAQRGASGEEDTMLGVPPPASYQGRRSPEVEPTLPARV